MFSSIVSVSYQVENWSQVLYRYRIGLKIEAQLLSVSYRPVQNIVSPIPGLIHQKSWYTAALVEHSRRVFSLSGNKVLVFFVYLRLVVIKGIFYVILIYFKKILLLAYRKFLTVQNISITNKCMDSSMAKSKVMGLKSFPEEKNT